MRVTISQDVLSSVEGHAGQFHLYADREMTAVPRAGEMIELAGGWVSVPVKYLTHRADGSVHARLPAILADCMAQLEQCQDRVTDPGSGWYWYSSRSPFQPG